METKKLALGALTAAIGVLGLSCLPARAQLDYKVSWIGNSFGKENSNKWVQNNIAALYVSPDGTCYTNSTWDEGHHEGGIYKNGDLVGNIADLHMNHWWGGGAVTGNATHLYVSNGNEIRRHNLKGGREDWNQGVGGRIHGLAVDQVNGLIYSADEGDGKTGDGEVRSYNLATKVLVASWKVSKPRRIAVAPDGTVWVSQRKSETEAGKVLHFSATGTPLPQTIQGAAGNPSFDPTALLFDGAGRFLVADNGPDQQVKIYTDLSKTSPSVSATFGAKGGIFSGTIGAVAPLKFNGLTGLGVDNAGNIYVSQNRFGPEVNNSAGAGSILESYSPQGTRNWQLLGLEFVDNADATPGTDGAEVYTKYARYSLDYSKTKPGSEWTYEAHTLNPFKYPDDERNKRRLDNFDFSTGYVVRTIGGKKFQFNTSMWGYRLDVYRFNAKTDGEIAIPCGQVYDQSIWRDLNGDGAREKTEFAESPTASGGNVSSYWVDTNGDLWQSYFGGAKGKSGIRHFKVQGLDAHGSPIWNIANSSFVEQPAPLSDIYRVEYVAQTDTMYLAGYSPTIASDRRTKGPNFNEKGIGAVLARYDKWSSGNRTPRWAQALPDYHKTPTSMAIAGDFVFVGYDGGSYQPDSGHTRILRASDGVYVGRMWAGPFNIGRMDIEQGVRALKLKSGEYVIFTEDDWYARVMMYRWKPATAAPVAVKASATVSDGTVNLDWANAGATKNADVYHITRAASEAGPFTPLATVEATSYSDENLTNETRYHYKIQGIGAAGDGPETLISAVPSNGGNLAVNSSFEADKNRAQTAKSWDESGDANAAYVEPGGHSGKFQGVHWSAQNYSTSTSQTKTGLTNGLYTLTAWVRNSGGQKECVLEAKEFGGATLRAELPTSPDAWKQVTIPNINVANGTLTFGVRSAANGNNWCHFDDFKLIKQVAP